MRHAPVWSALLALTLAVPAAPDPAAADDSIVAIDAPGPVERLYKRKQLKEAVLKADELRGKGTPEEQADNEMWAARALRRLGQYDVGRTRLQGLVARLPDTEIAPNADIDRSVMTLLKLGDGKLTDEQTTVARAAATELEATAKRWVARAAATPKEAPESLRNARLDAVPRALYIAGNAWRMAGEDDKALGAYERCRTAPTTTEYPPKCMRQMGVIASRNFDIDKARKLYTDCAVEHASTRAASSCTKSLAQLDVIGTPAPPLEIETWINGPPVDMNSLRGNVVLMFFFATWCPHCKAALPTLPDYAEQFKGQPFKMIALTNNSRGQTTESAAIFVRQPQWRIDYPVAVDLDGRTSRAYSGTSIPAVVLVDKQGTIRWNGHPNFLTDGMIQRLLSESKS